MKIAIEEKDDTQKYRVIPIEQFMEAVKDYEDRIEIFVPNLCGGETRVTIFKTEYPLGNVENILLLRAKRRRG